MTKKILKKNTKMKTDFFNNFIEEYFNIIDNELILIDDIDNLIEKYDNIINSGDYKNYGKKDKVTQPVLINNLKNDQRIANIYYDDLKKIKEKEQARIAAEAAARKKQEAAEAKRKAEAEAEARKRQEEAAARKKQEAEARKKQEEAEKAARLEEERKRQEAEAEEARKLEEAAEKEAAEAKRKAAEKATREEAERKLEEARLKEEERLARLEAKRQEEAEAAARKKQEEAEKAARLEEEKKKAEEERLKAEAERIAEVERKRKAAEERKRQEEAAEERKRQEEAAARKKQEAEEELARQKLAEEERKRKAEEERKRKAEEEERKSRENFTISIVNIKKNNEIKSVLVMYSDHINFKQYDIDFFNQYKDKDYVTDVIYSHSNNNKTYYNIFKKKDNDVVYIKNFINNVYKYLNENENDISSEYLKNLVMENNTIKPVTIIIPLNLSQQNGGGAYKRNYKKKLNKKNVPELRHMAKAKGINIKKKDDNGKSYYIKKADIINKLYKYKYKKNKQRGGFLQNVAKEIMTNIKETVSNLVENYKRKPLEKNDITISINNVIVEEKVYSIFSIYINNNKKFDDDDTKIINETYIELLKTFNNFQLRIMSKGAIKDDYSYHLLNYNIFTEDYNAKLIEFIKEIFIKFGNKDNMIYILPELELKENKNISLPINVQEKEKTTSGGSVMKKIYKEKLNKRSVKELQEMVVNLGIKLITKKDGKKYYCKKAELIKKIYDNKFNKKQ